MGGEDDRGGLEYIDALLANGNDVLVAGEASGGKFPLTEPIDPVSVGTREFISCFNSDEEAPDDSDDDDNPGDITKSGSGGGGGGCFIQSLLFGY